MSSQPLLESLSAPPVVVTNPEVVKYLICQLFTEAILVLTLVLLVPSILWEEWRHFVKNRRAARDGRRMRHGERQQAGEVTQTQGGGDGSACDVDGPNLPNVDDFMRAVRRA